MRISRFHDDHPVSLARSLALGHQVADAIRTGKSRSHTAVAKELGVSKARVSQLVALTNLAPDIQAEIRSMGVSHPLEKLSERTVYQVVLETIVFARHWIWWSILKHPVGRPAIPLGVYPIEQLRALHHDLLEAPMPTIDREGLIRALAPAVAPALVAGLAETGWAI